MSQHPSPPPDLTQIGCDCLPIFVLFASPRSGTDLLQSLFDSHPQILQLPGPFDFVELWRSSLSHDDPKGFAYEFAWSNRGGRKSPLPKFSGQKNSFERWNRLGPDQDQSFSVDVDTFVNYFTGAVGTGPLDARTAFLGIHAAYAAASGLDPRGAAAILYHRHTPKDLSELEELIGTFQPILTYRHPLNAMASEYRRVDCLVVRPRRIAAKWKRFLQPLDPIPGEKVLIVCFDGLKAAPTDVIGSLAKAMGIAYLPDMLVSSWHGLPWWGDEQTATFVPGLTSHGLGSKWASEMPRWEALGFAWLLRWHAAELCGEDVNLPRSGIGPLLGLLLCFVPLRIERIVLMQVIRQALERKRSPRASCRLFAEGFASIVYRGAICARAIVNGFRRQYKQTYFARVARMQ